MSFHNLRIHDAFVMEKETLVGRTLYFMHWREAPDNYIPLVFNWLDNHFDYNLNIEGDSLFFSVNGLHSFATV